MSTIRRQRTAAAVFIVPFFVLFLALMVAPILYAAWTSLFREQSGGLGFGGTERRFVGLGNYTRALTDQAFQGGFGHLALYCALYIPVMIGGAMVLALLLDGTLVRAKRFFQLAFFLPHAVPSVIAAIVWVYLYTPGLSPVLQVLNAGGADVDLFGKSLTIPALVNVTAWQWIGYNMIIFYAALLAIPRELLEAATVDGAGEVRTALRVKIPMIRSAIVMTMLFTIIGSIQLFTEPTVMLGRSDGVNAEWSPTMFIYSAASQRHDDGLASAASLLVGLLAGGLSFAVTRLGNRRRSA
ncbi:sugar ABC transporter permease [Actinocorallia longicatena]|uniref:Sugar ABC transporter permease n=1 Tax=Actinocorallia longicatena TaxID=111803 RepID=A0ABP6QM64_9ACTN